MGFKPMGNRILVERSKPETTTRSGILISTNENEKPTMGKIVAISEDVKQKYQDLSLDRIIYFQEYKVHEIQIDNKKFLVVNVDDILGIEI